MSKYCRAGKGGSKVSGNVLSGSIQGNQESTTTVLNTNQAIYGEDTKGVPDPSGQTFGWYFRNTEAITNKINWNFVANLNSDNTMKVSTFSGFYAVVTIVGGTKLPQFEIYTTPKNNNKDASPHYRSKRVFSNTTENVYDLIGQTVVLECGASPDVLPNLPRISLVEDESLSEGGYRRSENIALGRLSTIMGCPEGDFEFVVRQVGFINNQKRVNQLLVTNSIADLTPVDIEYSQDYYIALDSTSDHIVLSGAGTRVLDCRQASGSWCLGIELPDVDPADNDNWWATLFRSGTNSIQIARGAGNWGVYFMIDALSAGQSNTWEEATSGSKILFQYDHVNNKFEYWINGVRRAHISVTANANKDTHTSGELKIGKGYRYDYANVYSSNDWIGGVDNVLVGEVLLDHTQIAEYFSLSDVSTATFYDDLVDFVLLGEAEYPTITGMKQVITGTLVDGTEDDFVER